MRLQTSDSPRRSFKALGPRHAGTQGDDWNDAEPGPSLLQHHGQLRCSPHRRSENQGSRLRRTLFLYENADEEGDPQVCVFVADIDVLSGVSQSGHKTKS